MPGERARAELALLGSFIAKHELLNATPPILMEPGVLSASGQKVYAAMLQCMEDFGEVDILLLRDALHQKYNEHDWVTLLTEAMEGAPVPSHARHYAKIVERFARHSELLSLTVGLQKAVEEEDGEARVQEHLEGIEARLNAREDRREMAAFDLPAIMNEDLPPVPWVIPGWMAERDVALIAGEPGSGKSVFALDLAISLASGSDFLGMIKTSGQRRVMYIDEEMSPMLARRRLRQLISGRELEPGDLELRYYNGEQMNLDKPECRLRLRREVDSWRPSFIVLDSLIRFHDRDENSAPAMAGFYRQLRELATEYEFGWVILHHLAKPSKDKSKELGHRVRGSSDIRAAVDQLYGLEGDSGTPMRTLTHDKNRWGEPSLPISMVWDESDDRSSATLVGQTRSKDAEGIIVTLLLDAEEHGASRPTIIQCLSASGYKAASRLATQTLGKMHGQGTVKKDKRGRRMHYWHKDHAPQLSFEEE